MQNRAIDTIESVKRCFGGFEAACKTTRKHTPIATAKIDGKPPRSRLNNWYMRMRAHSALPVYRIPRGSRI